MLFLVVDGHNLVKFFQCEAMIGLQAAHFAPTMLVKGIRGLYAVLLAKITVVLYGIARVATYLQACQCKLPPPSPAPINLRQFFNQVPR